jgi:hypothetical protein
LELEIISDGRENDHKLPRSEREICDQEEDHVT